MMRKYDDQFKRQAVRKILDGQSVASVSRELGVAEGNLHTAVGKNQNWQQVLLPNKKFWNSRNG
ncbi:MAG TPA: transposase [Pyrinomonadaceae bacterium]|nr:transposase [Pyrinomonadaceae bacterium]